MLPKRKIDESLLPDGGWGWLVVFGVALTNMFNHSLISVFGLLFGEQLESMGYGTTGVSLISNVNNMVLCLSGLIAGPVLKTYTVRRVTIIGALFSSSGMILTSFATTMAEFIIFYSICTAIGLGLLYPATFVAIKQYFSKKRGTAVGFSMAGTGVGQMLMPQIVRYLLDAYGYRWATRIIGALCLHGIAGAILFEPVHKHLKKSIQNEYLDELVSSKPEKIDLSQIGIDMELKAEETKINLNDEKLPEKNLAKESSRASILKKVVELLDLKLLKDPIFINIMFGLGLVYTSGTLFSMLYPFFLIDEVHLTRSDAAFCMSALSAMDIIARMTIPTATRFFNISNRTTFLFGTLALAVSRSVIAEQTTLTSLMIASLFCGYIRAATVINQNLTCSDYCTDEQLPAALGLVMVSKGILIMSLGQLVGWFRDYSRSYSLCVHVCNILMIFVFICWMAEYIYDSIKTKKTST